MVKALPVLETRSHSVFIRDIKHVHLRAISQFSRSSIQFLLAATHQDRFAPLLRHRSCQCQPNAGCTTGDHDAFRVEHHE